MKKPIIIANWKMNPDSLKEAGNIFELIKKEAVKIKFQDKLEFAGIS